MNKSDKLHALYRLFSTSRHPVTLAHILLELDNCSRQTFFRLRRDLESRYRVSILEDSHGGYRFEKDPEEGSPIPGLWFSQQELSALLCLENALETLQSGVLSTAIAPFRKKIHGLIQKEFVPDPQWLRRVKILPQAMRRVNESILKSIAAAVLQRKRLRIVYLGLQARKSAEREISPQTLLLYRDNWYVDAWCHVRDDLRTFALSRIGRAEVLATEAKEISNERLETYYSASYGIFCGPAKKQARIRFYGIAAHEVACQSWHPAQKGSPGPNGTFDLCIPYSDNTELLMDVLRWGELAEILEPAELRDEMRKKIGDCVKKYRSVP